MKRNKIQQVPWPLISYLMCRCCHLVYFSVLFSPFQITHFSPLFTKWNSWNFGHVLGENGPFWPHRMLRISKHILSWCISNESQWAPLYVKVLSYYHEEMSTFSQSIQVGLKMENLRPYRINHNFLKRMGTLNYFFINKTRITLYRNRWNFRRLSM